MAPQVEKTFGLLISHVALAASVISDANNDPNPKLNYHKSYESALKCLVGNDFHSQYKDDQVKVLANEALSAARGRDRLSSLQQHFGSYLLRQYRREQSRRSLPQEPHLFTEIQNIEGKPLRTLSLFPKVKTGNSILSSRSLDLSMAEEEEGTLTLDIW